MPRLSETRATAAAAAIKAFVTTKDPRQRRRDRGASILDPQQNPDLLDDLTDLVADVMIWAREAGLDTAWIARVSASHAEPAHVADDEAVDDVTQPADLMREHGPVALMRRDAASGRASFTTVARFDTVEAANVFLATSAMIDPDDLAAGRYHVEAAHVADDEAVTDLAEQQRVRDTVIRFTHYTLGERGFIRWSDSLGRWTGHAPDGTACPFIALGVPSNKVDDLNLALLRAVTRDDLRRALETYTYRGSAYTLV